MAKRTKVEATDKAPTEADLVTADLISAINKEFGMRVAYNLGNDEAPTIVKRWVSTGSVQLDYAIRNAAAGGYPEGRIIEITGMPSCGKSHLAFHAAANVQAQGGLVVYIDTENATMLDKLQQMGINVRSKFVYCDTHCTEEVFKIIESVITKAKQMPANKDIPILVVWDSIAASSPKAELDGDYDQNTVGLQARTISKGMRKLTGVIGQNNVTLLCLNQLREAIGVMHGDPLVSPGGKAVPFHASVRVRLGSGTQVKDAKGNVVGIHILATIKKNKVGRPFSKCEFDIIFGKGIVEHEYVFDEVRSFNEKNKVVFDGKEIKVSGTSSWKSLIVSDAATGEVTLEKKFYKSEFGDLMKDPQYKAYLDAAIDAAYSTPADGAPAEEGDSPDTDEEEAASE
jgi:recombination protein RecA